MNVNLNSGTKDKALQGKEHIFNKYVGRGNYELTFWCLMKY